MDRGDGSCARRRPARPTALAGAKGRRDIARRMTLFSDQSASGARCPFATFLEPVTSNAPAAPQTRPLCKGRHRDQVGHYLLHHFARCRFFRFHWNRRGLQEYCQGSILHCTCHLFDRPRLRGLVGGISVLGTGCVHRFPVLSVCLEKVERLVRSNPVSEQSTNFGQVSRTVSGARDLTASTLRRQGVLRRPLGKL